MRTPQKSKPPTGERTLIAGVLFSSFGPFVTLYAAISSGSATQIADFVRRSAELVASLVSWIVFRRLHRQAAPDAAHLARLERAAGLTVAYAMLCSGIALCAVGIVRLLAGNDGGKSVVGLATAVLGLVFNSAFWLRYRRLSKAQGGAVLAAQQRLYRAKVIVDLCVSAALAAAVAAPGHPATQAVDALGSLLVAAYLLQQGVSMRKRPLSGAARAGE